MLFVLVSDKYGIFLGGSNWSRNNPPEAATSAPTFMPTEYTVKAIMSLPNDAGMKFCEVTPDLPGNRASIEACANALLPRWGAGGDAGGLSEKSRPSKKIPAKKGKPAGTRTFDHKKSEPTDEEGDE